MTVEVKSDGPQNAEAAEVVKKEEVAAAAAEEEKSAVPTVVKNSSFREESNVPSDLKESERKALAELRAKLEEAILESKLFKKAAAEAAKESAKEEKKETEVSAAAEESGREEKKETEVSVVKEEKKETEDNEKGTKTEAAEEEKKEEGASECKKQGEGDGEKTEGKAAAEPESEGSNNTTSEEEKAAVDKDISLWGVPLLPSKGDEGTDVVLLKFLRARDFKVGAAFEMLEKTLEWRREWNVDALLGGVDGEEIKGACYMEGADREGHPVCYNVLGVLADDGVYEKAFGAEEGKEERFLRWRVQVMERGVEKLEFRPDGVTSLLQVTDLKNSPGPAKKELRAAMKQVLDLLQDNYPELVARNILINVPFWYYAFSTIFYPFLTQRTKSKFVIARPSKTTETLLKYIPAEAIPVKYGGLKRDDDTEFSLEDGAASERIVKANSTEMIEIPVSEAGCTLTWDLTVLGWEVNYKEEFVPTDEGSYTIIIKKGKKMSSQELAVRNSFRANEPGKVVLVVENVAYKKKKILFRYKAMNSSKKC